MKIMAVDLGDARTGLAVCDRTEFLGSPVGVIRDRFVPSVVEKVAIAAREYEVGMVVVGYPVNMDGTVGRSAEKCAAFAGELAARVETPVYLWDERATTVTAHKVLGQNEVYGKKRRDTVDEVAAALILESFLAWRKNHPGETPPQPAAP